MDGVEGVTAVAGVAHDGRVWIGADSAGVAGWEVQTRADQKVFIRTRDGIDCIFGYTTSFRMGQLLRFKLEIPALPANDDGLIAWMASAFIDAVRACLHDGGFAQKENEREEGGEFLVGLYGRLFGVAEDYQVGETLPGYDAIGSGSSVALGALAVTEHVAPAERIVRALRAAERHNIGVRGPFTIVTASSEETKA